MPAWLAVTTTGPKAVPVGVSVLPLRVATAPPLVRTIVTGLPDAPPVAVILDVAG